MLRSTRQKLGGGKRYQGLDTAWAHPHGVPKRTWPMRESMAKDKLHPGFAPNPGGFWFGKYTATMPLVPFEINFYRIPLIMGFLLVITDLNFGLPLPFNREEVPGKARHFWNGNNGGQPHHFWCYQDGWFMQNESGAKRLVE